MAGTFVLFQRIVHYAPKKYLRSSPMSGCNRALIGKREIVGFGHNGQASYADLFDFPFPAIRWKEPTPEILGLREKEKGDWNELTVCEKKALYRASFRQTYAEFTAPTGHWKTIIGMVCTLTSCGIWIFFGLRGLVYSPPPDSFCPENREAQLRRMIDLKINPVEGISSKWDYSRDDWKK